MNPINRSIGKNEINSPPQLNLAFLGAELEIS
jgi:hypothetical protein